MERVAEGEFTSAAAPTGTRGTLGRRQREKLQQENEPSPFLFNLASFPTSPFLPRFC